MMPWWYYISTVGKYQYLCIGVKNDWLMCLIKSYNGFVSDKRVPDAGHGLSDAQVGIKLVSVETGH